MHPRSTPQPKPNANPGLCLTCRYSRRMESDRGSVFWQCHLSFSDPRFAKYPRLPVLECMGYEPKVEPGAESDLTPGGNVP